MELFGINVNLNFAASAFVVCASTSILWLCYSLGINAYKGTFDKFYKSKINLVLIAYWIYIAWFTVYVALPALEKANV